MRIDQVTHAGHGYTMMTADELIAAGVPQPAIDAGIASTRRTQIKAECQRRIYAVANTNTQINMASAAAVIAAKTAAQRSDPEKAILTGLDAAIGWVNAMRANVATLSANVNADVSADASWPATPDAVTALVAQF